MRWAVPWTDPPIAPPLTPPIILHAVPGISPAAPLDVPIGRCHGRGTRQRCARLWTVVGRTIDTSMTNLEPEYYDLWTPRVYNVGQDVPATPKIPGLRYVSCAHGTNCARCNHLGRCARCERCVVLVNPAC